MFAVELSLQIQILMQAGGMVGEAVRLLVQVAESLKSHMAERLAKDKEQNAFPTEVAAGHHTQA